jgi:predicted RNase H-like HicB family nuclease
MAVTAVNLTIDTEPEDDGRWIGAVAELPGVLGYGQTREKAVAHVKSLAFRVLADRVDPGENTPAVPAVTFVYLCRWPSSRSPQLLRALRRIGWSMKNETDSHEHLLKLGWPDIFYVFDERAEIGPRMLSRIAKMTGLRPDDL